MLYELFTACIEASRVLGVDDDFRARLEAARAKLPPYRIGRNGQLQEWEQDDGGQTNHRHTSHLVGLFPLAQITPRTTPDLAQAAVQVLGTADGSHGLGRRGVEPGQRHRLLREAVGRREGRGERHGTDPQTRRERPADHLGGGDRRSRRTTSSASTATARARRASRKCSCRATIAPKTDGPSSTFFRLCRRPGQPGMSPACGPAAVSRSAWSWKDGQLLQARIRRCAGSGRAVLRYGSTTFEVNLPPDGTSCWEPR